MTEESIAGKGYIKRSVFIIVTIRCIKTVVETCSSCVYYCVS